MGEVKDAKGLALSWWNRYYRKLFWGFILAENLVRDFKQEAELIGLEIRNYSTVREASNAAGRHWYRFLRNVGLRKQGGRLVSSESKQSDKWWQVHRDQ